MPVTKPVQAPFSANLLLGELALTLDTGQFVAVSVHIEMQPTTGNAILRSKARQIDATGQAVLDINNHPIESSFTHTTHKSEIQTVGGVNNMRRLMVRAVLGEDTTPLWKDPVHATVLENASIRINITTAGMTGPSTNLGTLF